MNPAPRVRRNDWSTLTVPALGDWRPELSVSVIIPAFNCQESLDLTLASLSRQTYPAELLEVVVVDDGSEPPITLPENRPTRTRLIRAADHSTGWGRANALHVGATQSTGAVLHWLDADMVAYPEHVEAQLRWHHQAPYAVTLGYKRFVDTRPGAPDWPTPAAVVEHWDAGTPQALFATTGEPHDYVERYIDRTDKLRAADHLAFTIHAGATAALSRELYEACGGLDTELRLGEDTELGYRLAQAGALFVPEPGAGSWHLGASHVMRAREQVQRYNRPFLADRMPYPRWLRKVGGTGWSVPLVDVRLTVGDGSLERIRTAVDAILGGDEPDLVLHLVGPWDRLDEGRRRVLADPELDLRLIAETYRGDPRVRLVTEAPADPFPAAWRLDVSTRHGLGPHAVGRLVELADREQVGLVELRASDAPDAPVTRLWRTAALGRARRLGVTADAPADLVTELHGSLRVPDRMIGVIDLDRVPQRQLAEGIRMIADPALGGTRWVPSAVEVAGVRSLAKATMVVGTLAGRKFSTRVRRRLSRPAPPAARPGDGAGPEDGQP
ncbi:glycosyltransferase [Micromonospora mirobrigensis]|uniref:Glycosyltransferase, GT2 family n=1 Tax=Micromonospora mirobrigensis TaxID=262898 RepID=A0A1C4UGH6_9ACTN|nr:glycosyltransferase [Micromonospora mirobrigensis]SCE70768.1 Glycosyltransferase, GT2 family [Micromonospora mirobrigensis]